MKTMRFTNYLLAAPALLLLLITGCNFYEAPPPPPPNPCNYGAAGYDGQSFLALEWETDKPDYVWTNNDAIPHVFSYGSYYLSYVGSYELYYEGTFYEGCCPAEYYWDVVFDIWYHPGTPGGPCGQAGANGVDSYLMMVMNPYGPYEVRQNKTSGPLEPADIKILEQSDTRVVTEQTTNYGVTLRATWTKLEKSRKGELDPAGERIEATSAEPVKATK